MNLLVFNYQFHLFTPRSHDVKASNLEGGGGFFVIESGDEWKHLQPLPKCSGLKPTNKYTLMYNWNEK